MLHEYHKFRIKVLHQVSYRDMRIATDNFAVLNAF